MEVKTKTPNGVSFKVFLSQSIRDIIETFQVGGDRDVKNYISGDIETKFADLKRGFTLTQSWTTSNVLRTSIELENCITRGLKLDVATSLQAEKMAKGAVVSATYKQPGVNSKISLDAMKVCRSNIRDWQAFRPHSISRGLLVLSTPSSVTTALQ